MALLSILPNNLAWLAGVTGLLYLSPASSKKMLVNMLVAKGLFEAYLLVVKNVQEADLLDYVFPYMTLFQRRFLADYLFAIIFTLVGHAIVSSSRGRHAEADLKQFCTKASQAGVDKEAILELETIAKNVGIVQSKKDD